MSVRCGTIRDVTGLPNPWMCPVLTVPIAGELLGLSRTGAYEAARAGELPTITLRGVKHVPVAELYRVLGLPIPVRPAAPHAYSG